MQLHVSFLHAEINILLWFKNGERPDSSPCDFHPVLTAGTRPTWIVAGSITCQHRKSCSSWVMSACLGHYDAAPYLAMLLIRKSSAAVWSAAERGTGRTKWVKLLREKSSQGETQRQRGEESGWYTESSERGDDSDPNRRSWDGLAAKQSVRECMQQRKSSSLNTAGQPRTVNQ